MTLAAVAARRRLSPDPPDIPTSAPYNVATHLTIPTYDGSGQAVHPDVIDFANEPVVGGEWQGWRFWMVMTPYPSSLAAFEDPSILVSHDGITWQVPAGLTNPIYLPTEGPYSNDPDIVYDPVADQLVLFWRDFDVLKMARSADGITWPATPTTIVDPVAVSPCFLRAADGTWLGWFNNALRTATAPEGPWTSQGAYTGLLGSWHRNIVFAPGGGYHMLSHDNTAGKLWVQAASSADGISWSVNPTPVLIPGTHAWSAYNLYRSALTLHDDGDRYRVWYCGVDSPSNPRVWRIAYTEIPLTEWPAIP